MARSVTMRVGETLQLHGAAGEVERWASDRPAVASVTDEDILTGRAGGLVTARSPGRARIVATGFDRARLVEVDVLIEGAPPLRLAVAETVPLPAAEGVSGLSSSNTAVAEVTETGQIRGLGPGIAVIRGRGAASPEYRVEVTGTLEAEVNSTLDLAARFAVPVRSWRTSTSAVSVNSAGQAATGDRPRTVEIQAELDDGSTFSFDLRVHAPQAAAPPLAAPLSMSPAPSPPPQAPPPPVAPAAGADAELARIQGEQVDLHLKWAEEALRRQDWPTVMAQLRAADVAAAGHEALAERARLTGDRLRGQIAGMANGAFQRAVEALGRMQFEQIDRELAQVPALADFQPLAEKLRALVRELSQTDLAKADPAVVAGRLQRPLREAWRAAESAAQFAALPALAELAMSFGDDGIVSTMIETLIADRAGAALPVAIRESLEACLCQMGDVAPQHVLRRLADPATPGTASNSLAALLAGLHLERHGRLAIRFHAGLPQPSRQLLVSRLALLAQVSFGALCDLLAGVLQSLPADPSLAKALQRQLGAERLEREARTWAAGGHASAAVLLRRLYDYPAGLFPAR
jgi:hypothetical protein